MAVLQSTWVTLIYGILPLGDFMYIYSEGTVGLRYF